MGSGQQRSIFREIFSNIPLFVKYLAINHLFETWVSYVTRVPETQVLWKKILQICRAISYFVNIDRSIHIFPNSGIWPFWPWKFHNAMEKDMEDQSSWRNQNVVMENCDFWLKLCCVFERSWNKSSSIFFHFQVAKVIWFGCSWGIRVDKLNIASNEDILKVVLNLDELNALQMAA